MSRIDIGRASHLVENLAGLLSRLDVDRVALTPSQRAQGSTRQLEVDRQHHAGRP